MPPEVKVNPVPTRFICNNRIKDHLEVGSHRGRPGSPLVFSLSLSLSLSAISNIKYQKTNTPQGEEGRTSKHN